MRIFKIRLAVVVFSGLVSALPSIADQPPTENATLWTTDYFGPSVVIASTDCKTLFVAGSDAKQIAWVDLASETVTRRITVPAEPTGLALTPDGKQLIVTCAAPKSTIVVLDAASGETMTTMPAGHTVTSPVVSPDGKTLYVCNRFDTDVSILSLATGKTLARIPVVREPVTAAVTPDGRTLFVANHLPNTRTDMAFYGPVSPVITVIDTATHATSEILLPAGSNALREIIVSADGRRAYLTHLLANFERMPTQLEMGWMNVNCVSVIDVAEKKRISSIGLDALYQGAANPWGLGLSADGKTLCVAHYGSHDLSVVETEKMESEILNYVFASPLVAGLPFDMRGEPEGLRRLKLPGHGPRGLVVLGSKVYLTQYFSDSLAVVDFTREELAAKVIALGPTPKLTEIRRGELIFNDAMICYQNWQSCASCHPEGRGDAISWDLLNDGGGNPKNTKSLLYSHRTPPSMAEGVRESAEVAVRAGMEHILFNKRPEDEAAAVDAYLKSLKPVPSPHLVDGQLSESARRGQKLFEDIDVGCYKCHKGSLLTDKKMHPVGQKGPYVFTDTFDTPTLREVWRNAPYMSDGRFVTVEEVIKKGLHGQTRGEVDKLTDEQIRDLVEYVLSL